MILSNNPFWKDQSSVIFKVYPWLSLALLTALSILYAFRWPMSTIAPFGAAFLLVALGLLFENINPQFSELRTMGVELTILYGFLFWTLLTPLFSVLDLNSFIVTTVAILFTSFLLYFLILILNTENHEQLLHGIFLAGGILVFGVVAVIAYRGYIDRDIHWLRAVTNIDSLDSELARQKNIYGSVLMVSTVSALYFFLSTRGLLTKAFFAVLTIIQGAMVLFISSRTALLMVVAAIGFFLLQRLLPRVAKIALIIGLVLLVLLISALLVSEALVTMLDESIVLKNILTHRSNLWAASIQFIEESPWGAGVNGDDDAIMQYLETRRYLKGYDPHNTVLRYGVSYGLVAMFGFLLVSSLPVLTLPGGKLTVFHSSMLAIYVGFIVYQIAEVVLLGGVSWKSMVYTISFLVLLIENRRHASKTNGAENTRQ